MSVINKPAAAAPGQTTDPPPQRPEERRLVPIRWAYPIGVALPLIVLNCGWIANSEMRTGVTEVTISALFMGVTFILFVLTLLNLLIRHVWGARRGMNQPEMMVLYTMLSMSSVVAGVGHFGFFTTFLPSAFWFANPANGWRGFWYLLPPYIGPRDPAILKGFFEGHSTFFQPAVMAAWAGPLLVWGIFFLVLLGTLLCLGSVFRQRWADEEHLPFPIVALPLEMTREDAPLYRHRLLWLGFAFPLCLHSLNSLQSIYPTLPTWKINSFRSLVQDAQLHYPWTGLDDFGYLLHPAGVGFGYLINTDVTFSLWFFFLLKRVLNVWGVMENWRDPGQGWYGDRASQFPWTGFQGYGAWLAFGLISLWTGRTYFAAYLRRALRPEPAEHSRNEALTPRQALLGFLIGFLALCAFVWSSGCSWWVPIAFLGIYCLMMITMSRIRAETPVMGTEIEWVNPQSILTDLAGTSTLPRADLAHVAMLTWFNTDYRTPPMPHEIEGFVGLQRARGRLHPLVGAILLACAVAIVSASIWDLQLYYVNGAGTGKINLWRPEKGEEPWRDLEKWLHTPRPPNTEAMGAMSVGVGITVLLSALRARFLGFPLHPAAYVLNTSYANDQFWCDMFVAWLVKSLVLRYGGMTLYRTALPLFLGLILGDFVTGAAWSIVGTLLHLDLFRTYAT